MKGIVSKMRKALRWWAATRETRPVLRGAIFWVAFWGASVAAIAWVYSPGGIGDPNRDKNARPPGAARPAASCKRNCASASATPTAQASFVAVRSGSSPDAAAANVSTKAPTQAPTLVAGPSLPSVNPPTLTLSVARSWVEGGFRYLEYEARLTSKTVRESPRIETHIPPGTQHVECRDQAGASICTPVFHQSGVDHPIWWDAQDVRDARPLIGVFTVRLDASVSEGTMIVNHAHALWSSGAVSSRPAKYQAPGAVSP